MKSIAIPYNFMFLIFFSLLFSGLANATNLMIKRVSLNASSTTGELYVDGKFVAHTLELPWKNNRSYVSSIPDGTYSALLRYDKNDKWRIQLEGVTGGRTGIQIHVGNYPSQIEGCVLVGNSVSNSKSSVSESSSAYAALKNAFYGSPSPNSSPNKDITVTVSYDVLATSFRSKNYNMYYRENGVWDVKTKRGNYKFTELNRDSSFIYLSGKPKNKVRHLRIPLWGGRLSEKISSNGSWKSPSNAPVVERKN